MRRSRRLLRPRRPSCAGETWRRETRLPRRRLSRILNGHKHSPAGTGISYGHAFHTERPSLIATLPVGYGDGLSRNLSNQLEVLAGGRRCPQVGRITMDQSLADVTALRGRVALGDEVVIIGRQGGEEITADELAVRLGTINYEVVTAISQRVPRIVVSGHEPSGEPS